MNTSALSQKLIFLKERVHLLHRLLVAQRDSLLTHGIVQPAENDLFETLNLVRVGLDELSQMVLETDREFRMQTALLDVRVKLASGVPVQEVVEGLFAEFGAKQSALILKNGKGLFESAEIKDVIATQVIQHAASTGEALLTTNAAFDARFQGSQSIAALSLSSIAVVPIKDGSETIGVMYLDKSVRSGLMRENDLELLKRVAVELAPFITPDQDELKKSAPPRSAPATPAPEAPPQSAASTGSGPVPLRDTKEAPPTREVPVPELEFFTDDDEYADTLEDTVLVPRVTQPVQFSAYYPTEVTPVEWNPFYAYVFRQLAAPLVEADARGELGNKIPLYRRAGHTVHRALEEGTMITATPTLPGFQFNPPNITVGFYDDWQRFDFKMRAKDAALEQSVNGYLTFSALGIIIAEIPLSVFVTRKVRVLPLAAAAPKPYSSVFCSYSHRDTPVVERVERALKTLGLDFLRDAITLKSGQDWNDGLYDMIDKADIFQLFWSDAARKSQYVEREWRHALKKLDRPNFIRPVYWEKPIPTVPEELDHIHFTFQPDLVE